MVDRGFVEIVEVGPRDGLQNEPRLIPAAEKIALVDLLSRAGFRRIEVTSFVAPGRVPQLADAAEVMAAIARRSGVRYTALTPNLRGFEAARAAGADEVAVFASASEGFSRANLNCSVAESLDRFRPVMEAARAAGIPVRGYVSVVTDCPFDGPTPPAAVARLAERLLGLGCPVLRRGDPRGGAGPVGGVGLGGGVVAAAPPDRLAGHFHDTAGRALGNIDVALARGLRVFDAAAGGLGGCPYAPGAAGNVATEAVAAHLAAQGYATGLDRGVLAEAGAMAKGLRHG